MKLTRIQQAIIRTMSDKWKDVDFAKTLNQIQVGLGPAGSRPPKADIVWALEQMSRDGLIASSSGNQKYPTLYWRHNAKGMKEWETDKRIRPRKCVC